MNPKTLENIKNELTFSTSRSSGKGGQHVNKTETRVTLSWKYLESNFLSEEQKTKLLVGTHHFINQNEIQISSEKTRSQFKNKEDVIKKLEEFLIEFFTEQKKRKPTKIPKAVTEKRLKDKSDKGIVKSNRKKINVRRLRDE